VIIVTGGAGFIGSNLVLALNRMGRSDILVADNLRRAAKHRNLNCARFSDYVDKDDLFELLPKLGPVEAILHQGACSDTTESDGRYMVKNNYEYSKRLLAFAEERGAKFIYASSAAVYGDGAQGFREDPSCEYPLNVYGFSKLIFDNYVRARLKQARSQICGLRYFNVYGPQERHKGRMASVAMHLYDQLQAGASMRLFEGSENFLRDFIHVDDVAAVNLFFLHNDTRGIFNCGSGKAESFVAVAEALRVEHSGGALETIPFPDDLRGKYQRFTEANLSQLRAAGCQHACMSLTEGIRAYYEVLRRSEGYKR
jgi:ADP-L-glycero-D-manno-heptose 6-epimerase